MMATKGEAISLRGLKREELDKLSRLAAEKNMSLGSLFEKSGPHTFDGAGAQGNRRAV